MGCNIHAKNTLDLNYIHRARHLENALDVRTNSEVRKIEDLQGSYRVTYEILGGPKEIVSLTAKNVVVSAGSVGSTSLLLKMKKRGHLPKLNKWLGKKWSGNGDLLGFVTGGSEAYEPTMGPVITAAIEYKYKSYPDGFKHGMYIEDAGFPVGIAWYLSGKVPQIKTLGASFKLVLKNLFRFLKKTLGLRDSMDEINLGDDFAKAIDRADFLRRAFVLLGMGRDRADGEISIREDGEAVLRWNLENSKLHYSRVRKQMKKIAESLGGLFFDNPLTNLDKVIAVHPLGGCPMGDSEEEGFVNMRGEVFGYSGLYVVDGSIIPTSIGPNPSLTIAAMAEYIAEQIPACEKVRVEQSEVIFS
ncbi:Cholesterol oxidase precursor [compost metagenome]